MQPNRLLPYISIALYLCVWACTPLAAEERLDNWHQWRGPEATGVAPRGNPPLKWSAESNIAWKTAIPGRGQASPIIWHDQIFLVTATATSRVSESVPPPEQQPERPFGIKFPRTFYRFEVLSVDRHSGRIQWRTTANEAVPHEGIHHDNSFASASPVTDGEGLYVSFGSQGIYRFDLDGAMQWKRDLGDMETRKSFGEAASPVVHGDSLVVSWDHEGPSQIFVLDAATGSTRWSRPRDERSTWTTPLVVPRGERTHVVVSASNRVRSYDLKTGEVIWECGGQVGNVTPAPLLHDGLVFCMSGYQGKAVYAIPIDARGDITGTDKIAWYKDKGAPYVPSPVLYGDALYYLQSNSAILSCVRPRTGEPYYERQRLPGLSNVYSSPVAAAGRVYVTDRDGNTLVLEHGPDLKVLAQNSLGERVDASAAIVGQQIFLRGEEHLYAIGEPQDPPATTSGWPEFRGPTSDGHAPGVKLPLRWSETENVRWKTPIHDLGWSTPVILDQQVWMTTATADGKKMYAICVDRETGKVLHDILLFEVENPRPLGNSLNCYASPSPTIEKGRVYVHFGSYGTACLDTRTGKTIWQRRDLPCNHFRGPGSSAIIFENLLLLHLDGSDQQYVVALDKETGKTVWKTNRSTDYNDLDGNGQPRANGDFRKAFNTPLVIESDGEPQMISAGAKAAYAYDPRSGKELWSVAYGQHSSSSRPVYTDGVVILNTGYSHTELWAVHPSGRGDISSSHVVWKRKKSLPRRASPVAVDGLVYLCDDKGVGSCLDARTGAEVWVERLGGNYSSSPLYADGRIYFFNQEGVASVIRPGRKFEVLAQNSLDDGFMASPAVAGNALFLRTRSHLYRIENLPAK